MKSRTFNIKTTNNKDSKVQTLMFEGDLGIKNAKAIKETVQALKFNSNSVTIHLKNVEKIDITSIQIIRALQIDLNKNGKKTDVLLEMPLEIERLLNNTGFDKTL